ncbi:MAG: undecaprenyl-phosphate glucose phosphotransferase [Betaproteobacteria bacterium]|nr:undecaprenyl-phosphate glucose phosphotransferase [Betaproteobacteria bacterium]
MDSNKKASTYFGRRMMEPGAKPGGILRPYTPMLLWLEQIADIAIALAVLYPLTILRFGGFGRKYVLLDVVIVLTMLVVYQWTGMYRSLRTGGIWLEAQTLFKSWSIAVLLLAVLGFTTKVSALFSREVLLSWTVLGYLGQLAFHGVLRIGLRYARAKGLNIRHALLVGYGTPMQRFHRQLKNHPWLGIEAIGYLALPGEGEQDTPPRLALPRLGALADAASVVEGQGVDMAYITLPITDMHLMEEAIAALMPLNIDVHWVPDLSSFQLLNHGVREIGDQPILCLSDSPLDGVRRIGKRIEDVVLAFLILSLVSPVMLAVAIGVKLSSPGPVLFKQKRGGLGRNHIEVWKFRTMKIHHQQEGTFTQASRADPRITPFGAFLRRTSLDELPQFFNVLQGRMSIVGPRPHPVAMNTYYSQQIDVYMLRHRIKPGITGWAQVNGWRGETDELGKMDERVKHDLYYINNWSLWLDLKIIFLTIFKGLVHTNAY